MNQGVRGVGGGNRNQHAGIWSATVQTPSVACSAATCDEATCDIGTVVERAGEVGSCVSRQPRAEAWRSPRKVVPKTRHALKVRFNG
jgi:hypothetical protein